MRRVAYVCTDPGIPVFGAKGGSVHVQSVLRVLLRHGLEVDLICARPGGVPAPDLDRVVVHTLPEVRGDDAAARERSARQADLAVEGVLDRLRRTCGVDLVYERYALWGRTAMPWAQRYDVPSVLEVNAPLIEEQAQHRHLVDRTGAERSARTAISTARAVVCVSEPVARWARTHSERPAAVCTVPNGVDTRRVRPAPTPVTPADAERFTIGFVGTLKPWHGVDDLVDAAARLIRHDPTYRLLLVGDGPGAGRLRELAAELEIAQHVELTGAVPSAAIPGQLHRMDVAAAPYPDLKDYYFSPLKVYEYLAAGLPVVASCVGDLPDILEHGRVGSLVRPGDPEALASAIAELRSDAGRREELRNAAVRSSSAHDWGQVVARSLRLVGVELPEVADVGA